MIRFCKDCNLFLFTPCHDVHKQVPPLQILRGPGMPITKSQNFARIKDARVTYKAVKYTGGYLHNACHKSSYLGYFETSFENKEKKD